MCIQTLASGEIKGKNPEKDFNAYIEKLRANDVYISIPQGYEPIDTRGKSRVENIIGSGVGIGSVDWRYAIKDIAAVIEDDSCLSVICFPKNGLDYFSGITGADRPETGSDKYRQSVIRELRSGKSIEADLRMAHDDMNLDIRPLINVIAEDDMSAYANADTVVIYEFDMLRNPFMDAYPCGIGIYLRKKAHPALLVRLMLNFNSVKDKDKYIRKVLDSIYFGDNPSAAFVEAEEQSAGTGDLSFPTKYRVLTGILPDINDETLEEINRVREWCEAHGMRQLPRLSDEVIDALNRNKALRDKKKAEADSILNSDLSDDDKVLSGTVLDSYPHFPGEDRLVNNFECRDWLDAHIRYPREAADKGIGGTVIVNFVVCADGTIKDVSVNKVCADIDESLRREAVRVVRSMPRWVPATYNGKAVNAYATCPVIFKYDKEKMSQAVRPRIPAQHLAEDPVYDMKSVSVAPVFKGGADGLSEWIYEHIGYPSDAADAKIEGRVIVEFIIDKDGAVIEPKVLRGISDSLDKEALRVVGSMPCWTPGYVHGKPVRTRYVWPVAFRLAKAK